MVKTVRKHVKTDYSAEKSPILHIRWVKMDILHFAHITQPKLSKKLFDLTLRLKDKYLMNFDQKLKIIGQVNICDFGG